MNPLAAKALAAAAAELQGPLIRTSASVIGHLESDSVIVATTSWAYTVTVMLGGMRIALTVRPRGWLRKSLRIEGSPIEVAREVVDPHHHDRLRSLQPMLVELGPTALRLEHHFKSDVSASIHLAVSLARRARRVQDSLPDERLAVTA